MASVSPELPCPRRAAEIRDKTHLRQQARLLRGIECDVCRMRLRLCGQAVPVLVPALLLGGLRGLRARRGLRGRLPRRRQGALRLLWMVFTVLCRKINQLQDGCIVGVFSVPLALAHCGRDHLLLVLMFLPWIVFAGNMI